MTKRKRNGARLPDAGRAVPGRMKRYTLPDYCDCQSVVMRELRGVDLIEAAMWAERNQTSMASSSPVAQFQAEQRESMRLALVQVDDEAVNVDGVPFMAMDEWSMRTMRFINEFYADLNGVEPDELKNAVAGAEVLIDPATAPGRSEALDEEAQTTGA